MVSMDGTRSLDRDYYCICPICDFTKTGNGRVSCSVFSSGHKNCFWMEIVTILMSLFTIFVVTDHLCCVGVFGWKLLLFLWPSLQFLY